MLSYCYWANGQELPSLLNALQMFHVPKDTFLIGQFPKKNCEAKLKIQTGACLTCYLFGRIYAVSFEIFLGHLVE
jgi:hypothetical protein